MKEITLMLKSCKEGSYFKVSTLVTRFGLTVILVIIIKTRPSASENRCKLYPPKRQLITASEPLFDLEEGAQGQI